MTKYTRDEIIEAAKTVANELGGPFSLSDFTRLSGITEHHIGLVFPEGRWTEVKRIAGLEPHPMVKGSLSNDELLREFHRVILKLGKIPTWLVFSNHANVSDQTVSKRFGGRKGTLQHYQKWLEVNEPASPFLEQLQTKPKRRSLPSVRSSSKKVKGRIAPSRPGLVYVDMSRIAELRALRSDRFDFAILIKLCEELNICYSNECYLAVMMLVRSILNHVPPIFGRTKFEEVASHHGGLSLKKSLQILQNSSRNIADAYLHLPIRNKESYPNKTQVNFANDLDVLLAEIVRILK